MFLKWTWNEIEIYVSFQTYNYKLQQSICFFLRSSALALFATVICSVVFVVAIAAAANQVSCTLVVVVTVTLALNALVATTALRPEWTRGAFKWNRSWFAHTEDLVVPLSDISALISTPAPHTLPEQVTASPFLS